MPDAGPKRRRRGRSRSNGAAGRERDERATAARLATLDALVAEDRLAIPDTLPIAAHHDAIVAAIRDHQVVVVAGETGSGKSTQLPKLCLAAGRGRDGLVGHTQPRRVAARSIAARLAEELGTQVGEAVGATVRFDDQVGERTVVRVMTDGILLAELQRDRMLRRYDTLIIDEAHERSLNIDFLLGYLAQLLPSRPDLKVVITSATIDTARFAAHFARDGAAVPVIDVAGRSYPVEVRYRPFGEDPEDDRDQVQAIADAVEELLDEGPGDVLVFVSGEREIHDTADHLRRAELRDVEVLPLYARLSSAEQQRIFAPHRGRRVVLSTNVAETSLTVPGVRYVVDAGNARISRYSRRLKVQRLPIEPISRASADQRAGRCGRVAPGVCIRLYAEDDYEARAPFTQPEILRTNLAAVILQMTAIGLGDVAAFPFVEPPDAAAIRDGNLLLEELGALDVDEHGTRRLTSVGRKLARLPVDPRLGRMVIEAERLGCVHDVMVIAAALSIQDPRERPEEHRQKADELHKRFDVAGSDLLGIVALWDHLRERQRELSNNQFRKLCRTEMLNYLRVREWQDLFSQLRRAAGELGIRPDGGGGHPDHVHRAVLSGLLSHLGMRARDTRSFEGARGARFTIARGSVLAKHPPRWVVAAELVETDRLWARRVATVKPEWAEELGAHLVKYHYGDAVWDERRGGAVVDETATLYGLPIVQDRKVDLARLDPEEAHDLFVHHALVEGRWRTHHAFVARNKAFRARVAAMEARVRREDLLDDTTVEEFFAARVPATVTDARRFDRWWNGVRRTEPALLDFTDDLVATRTGVRLADFPDRWTDDALSLRLTYRFDPGGPLDGVNVHVPLTALPVLDADLLTWQIPGHRVALVADLLRTLPKDVRRELTPLADSTRLALAALDAAGPPHGRIEDALALAVRDATGVAVRATAFDLSRVEPWLRITVIVADEHDQAIDADQDVGALRARLARPMRRAVVRALGFEERTGITRWDVGEVPEVVGSTSAGHPVRGHPALVDAGESVSLRLFLDLPTAQRAMRGGVRRLLQLVAAPSRRDLDKRLTGNRRLAVAGHGLTLDQLVADCTIAAADRIVRDAPTLPRDAVAFDALAADAAARLPVLAGDALVTATDVLLLATRVRITLESRTAETTARSVADAGAHLARLVHPGFVRAAGTARLSDVLRHVRGIEHRVDRLAEDVARDRARMADVRPLERRYADLASRSGPDAIGDELVELGWMLEDLRTAVFAQPLAVKGGASVAKVARRLEQLGG